jgi:hypothetical protein
MKAGVQRFAPHVHDMQATLLEAADLAEVLRRAEVVVYATGSERVAGQLRPGCTGFEYRHTPDPGEIDRILLPMLDAIRGEPAMASKGADKASAGLRRSHES